MQLHRRRLLLCALAAATACNTTQALQRPGEDGAGRGLYEKLVAKGDKSLQDGDLSAAREAFERAASLPLFEVPNYEILLRIAEVRCRQSDYSGGLSLLTDFKCILQVDAGKQRCYLDSAHQRANPSLTSACFERMCSEMYISYYDFPTDARLARIRQLSQRADDVQRLCEEAKQR
jgi:hypothetical protein